MEVGWASAEVLASGRYTYKNHREDIHGFVMASQIWVLFPTLPFALLNDLRRSFCLTSIITCLPVPLKTQVLTSRAVFVSSLAWVTQTRASRCCCRGATLTICHHRSKSRVCTRIFLLICLCHQYSTTWDRSGVRRCLSLTSVESSSLVSAKFMGISHLFAQRPGFPPQILCFCSYLLPQRATEQLLLPPMSVSSLPLPQDNQIETTFLFLSLKTASI